jgi:hypothetical protein
MATPAQAQTKKMGKKLHGLLVLSWKNNVEDLGK